FESEQILVVNVNALRSHVEPAQRAALFQQLAEAVAGVPGVARAAASVVTPVSNMTWILWASKFVATLLYGLEPRDPATLAAAAAVLAIVAATAGWLPAHRASR